MSMSGASALSAILKSAPVVARRATVTATKTAQRRMVASVRSNLNGPARYSHRGKSRVYGQEVNLGGIKARRATGSRGGPPGKFTGVLSRGVGGKRIPIAFGPYVVGGVGIGGAVNDLKKAPLELKYPYFKPSIHAVEPEIPKIYAAEWAIALSKIGGL
jgi:hypothetical protein